MFIFRKVAELRHYIDRKRSEGKTIGFAPTMGALHDGHLSLIKQALEHCDKVVCSIFVNPTQFDDPDDLKKYPRTAKADIEKLMSVCCDMLFMPDVNEVYPDGVGEPPKIDFGGLDKKLEGAFRPGHFDGMVQVVKRLLEIVEPDKLFMGQKDFQQQLIVHGLIRHMGINTELVRCAIHRESDGLAMSSRNVRLSETERKQAPLIFETLEAIRNQIPHAGVDELKQWGKEQLEKDAVFNVDYLEIVNAETLEPIKNWQETGGVLICVAAFLGDVRLIDNVLIL